MAKPKKNTRQPKAASAITAPIQPAASTTNPLAGSLRTALGLYRRNIRSMLVATFLPLAGIATLRLLSDDSTGNQYSLIIALISIFTTMLLARLVITPWKSRETKLLSYYNTIMSRYLSGIGLILIYMLHTIPLLGGLFLIGLITTHDLALGWLAAIVPLCLLGIALMIHGGFSLLALMDDMSLTIMQAFRISGRLTRHYWRPLLWRAGAAVLIMVGIILLVALAGTWLAPWLQDAQTQLLLDAGLSWLITPWFFCYGVSLYNRMVEAYV